MKRFFLKHYRTIKATWEKYASFRYGTYFFITFALLTFILSANFISFFTNPFRPELGKPSPQDIRAPHDIDVIDKAATDDARQKEESGIDLKYEIDPRK